MIRSSFFPYLEYADLRKSGEDRLFRLFGRLEAFQARDRIWIRSGGFSISADLHRVPVYILPAAEKGEPELEEQPRSIPWRQISSLPAKTPIYIAGKLSLENGQPEFRYEAREPLLVVLYGGDEGSLLKRAVGGGRQRNEYWNQFTLVSLITGSIMLFLLSYFSLSQSAARLSTIITAALSLTPLVPLLPPGVLFLFLYRSFWKKARVLRSERDLHRLPLRFFLTNGSTEPARIDWRRSDRRIVRLPGGEEYVMLAADTLDGFRELLNGPVVGAAEIPLSIPPSDEKWYLLGAFVDGRPIEPGDPMVERLMARGNPEQNAQRCSAKARSYEMLSALFFAMAVLPNYLLVLLLLRHFIR